MLKESSRFDITKKDAEAIFRLYSVIAFIVVLVGVGVPVWWMTTRVYRASLPLQEMYEVEIGNGTDNLYGLPLSGEYDILITIVNPNPQTLKINLDGELIDANLKPFLSTFSEVIDFTVKTQWLYFTELGIIPKKIENYFAITQEQLPYTITPLEKKLWSHTSYRPSINLVLYFTSCKSPIYILDKEGLKLNTNSFISPRWGAISIINSDIDSCNYEALNPDTKWIISTFINQLRNLLQVGGKTHSDIEKFKLTKAQQMIISTKRTLKSLAQLLSEINSIVISDCVAEKINLSVLNLKNAEEFLAKNNLKLGLEAAKVAFLNSEAAFRDPSLLALLYFPDDQKYAVYIPLFLPIMIPVVMSVVTINRWYSPVHKTKID
ncbi:hypothetical protein FQR65_LT08402 [Abscondita terminalis]|nr:hypothetical protein FQR65_LT08402 [Abscondita terminalis]